MNFDELQKKWDNQPEKDIKIKAEYLTETKSLAEKMIKSFRREAIFWAISIVFVLIIPSSNMLLVISNLILLYHCMT